jgi:K(+)-stimulated pyrophosphate-energized sodium pump
MEGTGKPEYEKCVAISTEASLKKMMLPGAITIISPILIGFTLGPEALGGFLAGATVSGVLMGIFQNNAGGAWDNAKKSFEKGVEINGEMFYKKSEPHKASVTGDTVGDPFKDTSGPSMNILIKLMSIVSLVLAPTLAKMHPTGAATTKMQTVEISVVNTDSAAGAKIVNDSAHTVTISANTKTLLQALQEEGIAPIDNVKIQIKDGKITVNGKALTPEQNAKFSTYLKKDNK